MTRLSFSTLALTLAFTCTGCIVTSSDDPAFDAGGSDGSGGSTNDTAQIEVTFANVEPLGEDFVYEGWLIVEGSALSTGRFDVEPGNDSYLFEIDPADAEIATAFVLTIEAANGDDVTPSDVHYLAGDILNDGKAALTLDHPAALGTDFETASGSFILETPSSHAVTEDYDQGIWWLEMTTEGAAPALTLPELPAGWTYEGWVVQNGTPISTGRFTVPTGADDDAAGPDAGPDEAPPFPGQDFVDPALVLTNLAAVVSVEPVPDDSPAPFAIKPLVDETIDDLGAGVSQDMATVPASDLPHGTAVILR